MALTFPVNTMEGYGSISRFKNQGLVLGGGRRAESFDFQGSAVENLAFQYECRATPKKLFSRKLLPRGFWGRRS